MTNTVKILGQVAPLVTTLTTLYTVPALTRATSSSVVVCNRAATDTTFRISVAVASAVDTPKQYIYYDQPVEANSTFIATIGITLAASDAVRVYGASGDLSFNLFGVEVT